MNNIATVVASTMDLVLEFSRQNQKDPLTPWFRNHLDRFIADGRFPSTDKIETIKQSLIDRLVAYRTETGVSTAVLGMSGGVDSALTAALFKAAGWRVIGITMPIHQVEEETQRGLEACLALDIEHRHIDLSDVNDLTVHSLAAVDSDMLMDWDSAHSRVRRGNVRARLRMITLYSVANAEGGVVASTDNLSELGAGFWTICGDVGDVSPIQSLLKSWEVPYLAKIMGVPESIWRATPTDGLAVLAGGDEAQLGASYLEWDIMAFAISDALALPVGADLDELRFELDIEPESREGEVFAAVTGRMSRTWFKRKGPINFPHPLQDRYAVLSHIDDQLFVPASVR